jgi:hypothetical protein
MQPLEGLRTVCGHYADCWKVTEDALVFAANTLKPELSLEKRQGLCRPILNSRVIPMPCRLHDWTQRLCGNQSNYSAPQQLRFLSCIGGHFTEP